MTRSVVRVLALVSIVTTVAFAQTRRAVTAADYDRATRMLAPALNGLVVGGTADATWLPDGRFWYVANHTGRHRKRRRRSREEDAGSGSNASGPFDRLQGKRVRLRPLADAAVGPAVVAAGAVDAAVSRSRRPADPTSPE